MIFPTKIKSIFRLQLFITGYLPLIILSFIIVIQMNNKQEDYLQKNIYLQISHASTLIETFLSRLPLKLSSLIPEKNKEPDSFKKKIINNIKQFSIFSHHLKEIQLIDLCHKGSFSLNPDIFNIIKKTRKACFSATTINSNLEASFFIYFPLFNNNHLNYILKAKINMRSIIEILHSIHFGETGKVILLNNTGKYLTGVEESKLLKSFYPDDIRKKLLTLTKEKTMISYTDLNKKKYIAGSMTLNKSNQITNLPDWRIVLIQDNKESFYLSYLLESYLIWLIPLTFILVFIFNHLTSELVLTPVRILLTATKKATKGDLSVKTSIDKTNEIGELAYHFDHMIESLNQSQNTLKKEIIQKEKAKEVITDLNINLEKKVEQRTFQITQIKEFYENILNSITSGVMVLDNLNLIKFLNPRGEQLLHIKFDKINNMIFTFADLPVKFVKTLENIFKSNRLISREIIIDPETILGLKITPQLNIGTFSGRIIVFNNISERKKMEKELINSAKMFSFGLLSTGMAHDFNNILNRVKISNAISKKISNDIKLKEFHNEIDDAIDEGQSMTKSLLSFAKKEKVELIEIDLFSALKSFEEKSRRKASSLGVTLNLKCNKQLTILSNINYLQQVFQNLFQNAVQAFAGNLGIINIVSFDKNNNVIITFKDNGPGIEKDTASHIFEPFYSTKDCSQNSGWGLGLALVKSLIEMMNGSISVESTLNKGTEFIIKFPAIKINAK